METPKEFEGKCRALSSNNFIDVMRKYSLLDGLGGDIYHELHTLRKYRNKFHIQDDNEDVPRDEEAAFTTENCVWLLGLCATTLDRVTLCGLVNGAFPRSNGTLVETLGVGLPIYRWDEADPPILRLTDFDRPSKRTERHGPVAKVRWVSPKVGRGDGSSVSTHQRFDSPMEQGDEVTLLPREGMRGSISIGLILDIPARIYRRLPFDLQLKFCNALLGDGCLGLLPILRHLTVSEAAGK
ncbi:hypothetical protein PanWU01x14_341580 [Parasponia andersonii]|uniref:Uncharacterized protein n=1 Tax=Parasponia andersonii TaxID=3476 RepID=A0A2P5AE40_PARAD|nr:hypothetical protein PanWU01x14_341580 [Parasponia andersonii]